MFSLTAKFSFPICAIATLSLAACGGGGGAGNDTDDTTDDNPTDTTTTVSEHPARYIYYSAGADLALHTDDDVVTGYYVLTYDESGENAVQGISYNSAGPDGTWFTGDDATSYAFQRKFDAYSKEGEPTESRSCSGPGPDGIWGTADDVVTYISINAFDQQGNQISQVDHSTGADGTLGTSDDSWQVSEEEYDAAGNDILWLNYGGANDGSNLGPDGIALTDDDVLATYQRSYYDAAHHMIRDESYTDAGLDRLWRTADDPLHQYSLISYDAAGNKIMSCTYVYWHPGADGIAGNDDDEETGCQYWTYDANNNETSQYAYWASNASGILDGVHDLGGQYFTYQYDSAGNQTELVEWDVGPDEKHATADDIMMFKMTTIYDEHGREIERQDQRYGDDRIFGTADDGLTYTISEY